MDDISLARLGSVHPELQRRAKNLDERLLASSLAVRIRVVQGLRTWAEQDSLYAQGRTSPGKIVTEAKGGYTAHNFGYAVDAVPDVPGEQVWSPDWNSGDDRWKLLLATAKECGLAEGAEWRSFPDNPHFYLQELPATPDDNMRYIFREGGLEALWAEWATTLGIDAS